MPIYEYYCEDCDKKFEIIKKSSERDDVIICPICGKETTRMLSTFNMVFKGSGFYVTDYKKKEKK